jgi:hypothetical protein
MAKFSNIFFLSRKVQEEKMNTYRTMRNAVLALGLLAAPYVCNQCAYSRNQVSAAETVSNARPMPEIKTIENLVDSN